MNSILPPLKRVVIESPWRASQAYSTEQHRAYLTHCLADCVSRGEVPFASHLYLTEVLNDDIPRERALGIEAGWCWGKFAELIAVYTDFGISPGAQISIDHYQSLGLPVERRTLPRPIVDDIIRSGGV